MTTKFYSSIASHLIQTKPLFYGLTSSNSRKKHEKNIKQTYYYYVNTNKSDIALFHRTTNLQLFMCIFKFNKSSNDILNDNFFFLKKIKMKLKNSNIHLGIWAVCYIHNLWIFNIVSLIKYWKSCVKLLLYFPILQLTALSFCILCHGLGPD